MAQAATTRRELLLWCSAMGASWRLSAGQGSEAHQHSPLPASYRRSHEDLRFLSPEDARDIEAIAELIIPSDDTPGAREAGVVYFIDLALATFDAGKQNAYLTGLTHVRQELERIKPGATHVDELQPDERERFMEGLAPTEFFDVVRTHTIMGFFGSYGGEGNRGGAGWKLIGFEDKFVFKPPYGFYDAELLQIENKAS